MEMVGGDSALVESNGVLHDGQPQAGTLGAVGILLRNAVETLENLPEMLITDTFAGIIIEKVCNTLVNGTLQMDCNPIPCVS